MILCPAYSGPITDMRSGHQLGATCSFDWQCIHRDYLHELLVNSESRTGCFDAQSRRIIGYDSLSTATTYAMYIERNCVRSLGLLLHFHCRLFTLFPPGIPFEYITSEIFTLQKRERPSEPVLRGGCQTGDSRTSAPTIQPALEYSLPA